jgi:hypothetical protein
MKKTFNRSELKPENELEFVQNSMSEGAMALYHDLLLLLAQACDETAKGANVWVSIGKTKAADSLTLVVHTPDGDLSAFAGTLVALSEACNNLL